jgi:outer membrane cobalamin receptor
VKLFIVYIVLFCLFPYDVIAQNSFLLSGEIKDSSNTPIPQAMVFIEGTNMGAYSDNNGKYAFKITHGEHIVSVSAYGFSQQKQIIKIKSDESINFTLRKQQIDLASVSIYGKSKSQQLRESNFTVNAIEIKNVASSLNNINTLVGRSSGVNIRKEGGVGSDFDLSINGLSGNAIRYFIDGVPLESMGNGISLGNIPVNIVKRIEVYKGVVPAYLGTDALGGAINIITKKYIKNYLDASYGIGSFGTHKADFNANYIIPNTHIFIQPSVGINYSKNNYVMRGVEVKDTLTERFKTIDAERFHSDYFSALAQIITGIANQKWTDLFSVSVSGFYSDKELQTGTKQIWVYGMATRENKSFTATTQYRKENLFVKGLSTNLHISHTQDYRIVTDTAYRNYYWNGYWESDKNLQKEMNGGGAKSIRHIDRPLSIGRANFNYELNQNHSFNLNYLLNHLSNNRYDDLDNEFEASTDIFTKQILGLSYNQEFWKNRLNNTLFVKNYISTLEIGQQDNDWITGSDEVPSSSTNNNHGYGISSRIRMLNQLALKTSYEHSVRLPLAREFLGNGTSIQPNFKLRPEHSQNINIGLFGNFLVASKHMIYYETGAFYRKVEDYIRFDTDVNDDEGGQYVNKKNVTVQGVEGEIRYDYNNTLGITTNFTYIDEKNKTQYQDNRKPDISYNNRVPNRPFLFGNTEVNFRKKNIFGTQHNQLKIAFFYQYVHWFYLTWAGYAAPATKATIPTQHLTNAQLTYSFNDEQYNISFESTNVLDYTLYDNYNMQKPGRSFFLKLRIFIN